MRRLLAYRDGGLRERQRNRLRAHLVKCDSCASRLRTTKLLEDAIRAGQPPSPPEGLLNQVLAFRATGGRVLLPTGPWTPFHSRRRLIPGLGLVLLLGAGAAALSLMRVPDARAGASTLSASAWQLGSNRPTSLEFEAPSSLMNETGLRVRGWVRYPGDPPPRGSLGTEVSTGLAARGSGRFRGELALPPGAAYAALFVEDLAGGRIDGNGGRLWEVLATDADGVPVLAALQQQYRVAEHRHMPEALEVARRMTETYLGEPEGWVYRYARERLLVGPDRQDSLWQFHRIQFNRLSQTLSQPSVSADQLAAMARYAQDLDLDVAERWLGRLEARDPQHSLLLDTRVLGTFSALWREPGALVRALDALWWRSGSPTAFLVEQGYAAAVRTEDPPTVALWADRYRRQRPDLGAGIATSMAAIPELDSITVSLVRGELHRFRDEAPWDPSELLDVPGVQDSELLDEARLLTNLGVILARRGEATSARDTLERAGVS